MVETLAQSSRRRVSYKAEGTYGTAAGASGATVVRRTTTSINLTKEVFSSEEVREDFQVADSRHGLRRVSGSVDGELYPGAWSPFMAAVCRRDFTGVTTINASSGDGFTISSGVLTRAAGGSQSFLTDGVKRGMVVKLTGMNAANINRNLLVTAVTATTITLYCLDGGSLTDEGVADESASIVFPGKVTYIPTSGHTSPGFSIEDYFSDIDVSRLYTGCRIGGMQLEVSPNRMARVSWPTMGLQTEDAESGSAPYFTSPTAAGTQRALSATPAVLLMDGAVVAIATGIQMGIDLGLEAPAVIASNVSPNIFYGRAAKVSGQMTAFFKDRTLMNKFMLETEAELALFLESVGSAPADFVCAFLPRLKVNSASMDDPQTGVVQTLQFEGLLKPTTNGYESTSFQVQDSQAA